MAEASFEIAYIVVGARTIESILYLGVGYGIVVYGVSGRDIALYALIWRTRIQFIVAVAWSRSVCVMMMDVGMLGLMCRLVRDGTVAPEVSGCNIALVVLA